MPLTDRHNHEISNVEVGGTQKSADLLWDNSKITCWGLTDLFDGKGLQHGYYNVHADKGRDLRTRPPLWAAGLLNIESNSTVLVMAEINKDLSSINKDLSFVKLQLVAALWSVSCRFANHWTGRARCDYGYHEDTNGPYQELFARRNFLGNLVTLSIGFAFLGKTITSGNPG